MDYDTIVAQALAFLQQEKRVAYRVLKRRLQLDDEILEDLKDDLIYAKNWPWMKTAESWSGWVVLLRPLQPYHLPLRRSAASSPSCSATS